jgi:hypothetical protein
MINPFRDIDWNPDRAGRRRFARSLIVGFPILGLVIAAVTFARGEVDAELAAVVGFGGLAVGAVCYAVPSVARPLYLVWFALSAVIGLVVSNVLLALVFFTAFTGTRLLLRVLGRRPLSRSPEASVLTYWTEAPSQTDSRRFLRQF